MKWMAYLLIVCLFSLAANTIFIARAEERIDVNTAGPLELERLYRVNPRIARRIIAEREKNGPYLSLEDLAERVREIGPQTIARWEGLAVVTP